MNQLKIKICGMKQPDNMVEVASLKPDFMGFIFFEASPRNFEGEIPPLPDTIVKTGVFVDADTVFIREKLEKYGLQAVQLHGSESPGYCRNLKRQYPDLTLIKAFAIGSGFDFDRLKVYENECDLYLFDTKGAQKGGTGKRFDWQLLSGYHLAKPFLLSGGIGAEHIDELKAFFRSDLAKNCTGVDVNSRFENKPGLKNVEKLEVFINQFNTIKNEVSGR